MLRVFVGLAGLAGLLIALVAIKAHPVFEDPYFDERNGG